jgi:rare lipoprotein A
MRRRIAHGLAIAFLIVGLGAAQGPNISEAKQAPVSSVRNQSVVRQQVKTKPYQVGTASWYGQTFQGKPTASGEKYQMYDMTAAHLTLPMGSYVRVTNLRNGKAVIVRINDRGPVVPGRIIDLSYGAAQAIQMKGYGLQRVRLDLVKPGQIAPNYTMVASNHPSIELLP